MHAEALEWLTRHAEGLGMHAVVVDVGGRNINGSVRDLFDARTYIAVDLYPGRGVDVVADVRRWGPDELADLVVCAEVLEHADDPAGVVEACRRILRPGGKLLLTAAAPPRAPHSGIDGGIVRDGEYYGNIDPERLPEWLAGWSTFTVDYDAGHGDVYVSAVA